MGLSDRLQQNKLRGKGLSDYQRPRSGEWHAPLANYLGPGTQVVRRVNSGVKPTTATDSAAKRHDIQYHNIGVKLARKQISRAEAIKQVHKSDNELLRTAFANKLSINPVNAAHSTAVIAGISGKKILQDIGAMDELKFTNPNDGELLDGGRLRKKKGGRKPNLVKGLKKRFGKKKT